MKIVKVGNVAMRWPREWETQCCQSTLELDPQDIREDSDYAGGFNGYYINCPVCGKQPEVPGDVKHDGDRWLKEQKRIETGEDE